MDIDLLIGKTLQGEANNEEQKVLNDWLEASEENKKYFDIVKSFYEKPSSQNLKREKSRWEQTLGKIYEQGEGEWIFEKDKQNTFYDNWRIIKSSYLFKIAASIFFPLLVITGFYYQQIKETESNSIDKKVQWVYKSSAKGEKMNLKLPDGTSVKLNSSSKLSFQQDFLMTNERIVHLEGEAFFEVTKGKPFKVQTKKLTTTVLGTEFNVRNYHSDNKVYVAVKEGKVKVESEVETDKGANSSTILVENQMATLFNNNEGNYSLKRSGFVVEQVRGWKDGILVFEKEELGTILKELEEWYGVTFQVDSKAYLKRQFTGTFENKPLSAVLEGLGFSSHFTYEIRDDIVLLKSIN